VATMLRSCKVFLPIEIPNIPYVARAGLLT
jgi:hypothetical protein